MINLFNYFYLIRINISYFGVAYRPTSIILSDFCFYKQTTFKFSTSLYRVIFLREGHKVFFLYELMIGLRE